MLDIKLIRTNPQHVKEGIARKGANPDLVDIVPELRRRIKIAAAENNLTVQEYVGRILEQAVPPERNSMQGQYGRLDRAAVDKLLQTREAIIRAHPGQIFEDPSELIHQAHEERSRELEQR